MKSEKVCIEILVLWLTASINANPRVPNEKNQRKQIHKQNSNHSWTPRAIFALKILQCVQAANAKTPKDVQPTVENAEKAKKRRPSRSGPVTQHQKPPIRFYYRSGFSVFGFRFYVPGRASNLPFYEASVLSPAGRPFAVFRRFLFFSRF